MGSGNGPVVMISWAQTSIEGLPAEPQSELAEGMTWRWQGSALSLEGEPAALLLTASRDQDELKTRAARVVRKLIQHTMPCPADFPDPREDPRAEDALVVADDASFYTLLPVAVGGQERAILLFLGAVPPPDRDLTIVRVPPPARGTVATEPESLLCFTPGTRIATEAGEVPIEDLGPGDRVLTRDDGPQEILWMGHRRISGARLFALPQQRPVRLRAHAFDDGRPSQDLLVSPDHRVLVRGDAARDLWGEPEVLVRAVDLIAPRRARWDHSMAETYYIHLLLETHSVIWANGLAVESLHPGFMGLAALQPSERVSLLRLRPDLAKDAAAYGEPARRMLSGADACLLAEGMARARHLRH